MFSLSTNYIKVFHLSINPPTLRPFQLTEKNKILASWKAGARVAMDVLPTGAGKTVLFASILREHIGASCAIAHRQELVTQISLALARNGVRHRIIGPKGVVREAVRQHLDELGQSFYDPSAQCAVAGVDTLINRHQELAAWMNDVTLWVGDEGHHFLKENKWGTAVGYFPNAKGLLVTATPLRADGKGLGRHADGLVDVMHVGPSMRDLIDAGYLTEYRIIADQTDIDFTQVDTSAATGDFNANQMRKAVRKSKIVGDVVHHYQKFAPGKLGVTFVTDVETAKDVAAQFNLAGVPAAVVSAKTPTPERVAILKRFRRRELLQLVNVDLFGEGFDLPAIEVVSMARPTQSYALYVQQFGRALRLLDGKDRAIIIDHVGNVVRHGGPPDVPREWSLDSRDRRGSYTTEVPVRECLNPTCMAVYQRVKTACPYCALPPEPSARTAPEFVDGDLVELDEATLRQMRGEVEHVDMPLEDYAKYLAARRVPQIGQMAHLKRHALRQEFQAGLRASMAWWAGKWRARGDTDREIQKRFFLTFGVDVIRAKALNKSDADTLAERINRDLGAR